MTTKKRATPKPAKRPTTRRFAPNPADPGIEQVIGGFIQPTRPLVFPGAMTAAERQAKVKADFESVGGRRMPAVNLPPDANEDLKALLAEGHSIKSAVIAGLKLAARRFR